MPRWTKEQQQAIDMDNTNILVSAGAGSGKTAVLSERVLRKVKQGINIDQILILTFTKAAAYEMMIRIRQKIEKEVEDKKQLNRIDKAYITTFDSFALSIVKKYHDRLNIDKNVSIVDENVIFLLKEKYLDEILNEYYHEENNIKFEKLISDFCLRDDKELRKYILDINNKLDLKYNKRDYLDTYINNFYNIENINRLFNEYEKLLTSNINKINELLRVLEIELDGEDYYLFYDKLKPLLELSDYNKVKANINIDLPRLPKNTSEEAKQAKNEIKKNLDELKKLCDSNSKEELINNYLSTKDYVEIIIEIVSKLDKKIMDYKMANNIFEFTDISKLAISLVNDHEDVRNELKYYFNEIMIDEYQDTSDLQEEFIKRIENNNVYMVGDIKQSIYRFRNANPMIFKEKYDSYEKSINGTKIDLNKNFRSRKEVLEDINKIFNLIMDDNLGGARYQESHQMIFGNNTYIEEGLTNQDYNIDLYNYHVDKDTLYEKYTKDEIEAFIIGNDIKKKVSEHYKIFDKDTLIIRDITYNDFVILMDRSSKFTLYKKIFEYLEIPLTVLKDENIMDQNEVYLILNILKMLSNLENKNFSKEFEYSYISIARSYLFRYSDQEIFDTITNNKILETEIVKILNNILLDINNLDLKTLLSRIYSEFNFEEKLITFGNIEMGLSILEYFLNLGESLQNLDYDYHKFIEYLNYIIDNKKEIKLPVSVLEENSCKIMTIHKSKGLEYPICYYSGLKAPFNVSELKEKIIYDEKYGIITPCFKEGYQDTFNKLLLKKKYYQEEIGEKIRLFYVALTRCKEKMIIIADLEEDNEKIENGIVSTSKREEYRSFLDILKSIYNTLLPRIININLDQIPITNQYKLIKQKEITNNTSNIILNVKELNITNIEIEKEHFSKNNRTLIDNSIKKNMEFGTNIHKLLEFINFKKPDFTGINEYEKSLIIKLLNQNIFKDINNAKILKEYEFYYLDNNIEKHGIIDLMLEYTDHIDIIDYKLKNISDENYLKQLSGYKNYISSKTDKEVNLYLYSIIDGVLSNIEESL